MRIRNNREFDIYLSYAGQDEKGWKVPAGKLSPAVPAKRFYDPHLQHDWKKGVIDLVLTEADVAILGADVADLAKSEVTIKNDKALPSVTPTVPKPPPKQAAVPATPGVPTPVPTQRTVKIEKPQAVPQPVREEPVQPVEAAPVIEPDVGPQAAAADQADQQQPEESRKMPHCGKCGGDQYVKIDERVHAPLCDRCRAAVTRQLKKGVLPPAPDPIPAKVPVKQAQACPHPPQPEHVVDKSQPVEDPHVVGIPHTAAPQHGRSIADLEATNRRIALGTPKFGGPPQGMAIPTIEVGKPAVPEAPPTPRMAKIEGFLGDIKPVVGSPIGQL